MDQETLSILLDFIIYAATGFIFTLIIYKIINRKVLRIYNRRLLSDNIISYNKGYKRGVEETLRIKSLFSPTRSDIDYLNEIRERLKFRLGTEFKNITLTDSIVDDHFDRLWERLINTQKSKNHVDNNHSDRKDRDISKSH